MCESPLVDSYYPDMHLHNRRQATQGRRGRGARGRTVLRPPCPSSHVKSSNIISKVSSVKTQKGGRAPWQQGEQGSAAPQQAPSSSSPSCVRPRLFAEADDQRGCDPHSSHFIPSRAGFQTFTRTRSLGRNASSRTEASDGSSSASSSSHKASVGLCFALSQNRCLTGSLAHHASALFSQLSRRDAAEDGCGPQRDVHRKITFLQP